MVIHSTALPLSQPSLLPILPLPPHTPTQQDTVSDLALAALELGTALAHLTTICRNQSVVCQQLCSLSFWLALS